MSTRIDGYRKKRSIRYSGAEGSPTVSAVCGTESAAAKGGSKKVACAIYGERAHICVRKAVIDQRPVLAVIGRAVNAASFECAGKNVSIGVNRQRDHKRKFQSVVDCNPAISVVGGAKGAAKRPCKNVTRGTNGQCAHVGCC